MKSLLAIVFAILLLQCEIKKNPLAPNGPFGVVNLFYNLSKIDGWSYKDSEILYCSLNVKTFENQPIINREFINSFRVNENLPEGLTFNSNNGFINGTPSKELAEKEFKVYAKLDPFPEYDKNFANLKITVNDFTIFENINFPIYTNFPFPSSNTYSNFSMITEPSRAMQIDKDTGIITGDARTENSDTIVKVTATRNDRKQVVGTGKLKITEWVNEAYLKAPNAETLDRFGGDIAGFSRSAISISGDTIVVGAELEDSLQTTITNGTLVQASDQVSNTSVGAVYVFRRNGSTWINEAYLKAPNAEGGSGANQELFGKSTSISDDTIVVGSPNEDSSQTTITNGTLVQISDLGNLNSGAAYVFKRTGTTWSNEAYLKAPNAEGSGISGGDQFGYAVSISKDTIVVGAYHEDSNQTTITNGTLVQGSDVATTNFGAAYVFRRNGTIWTNEAYLKAPNAEGGISSGDHFGVSVSISGDTIVVGANQEDSIQTTITNGTLVQSSDVVNDFSAGAAYVFRRTGTTWINEAYLKPPNIDGVGGGLGDNFGGSVSISDDTIVVGAILEDSNQTTITNGLATGGNNPALNRDFGAAYVFRRTGTTWTNEAYLKAPNTRVSDSFGRSVSISGNIIVVGAEAQDSNQTTITNGTTNNTNTSFSDSGAAYVFKRNGTNWYNQAFLKAPNAGANDRFGSSVFIEQDTIIVSAIGEASNQTTITNGATASSDNSAPNSGAVYVFRRK